MLNTSIGPGEVLALTWEHVNLAKCELLVSQAVTYGPAKEPIISTPKTKKARRITFGMELAQVLSDHRDATAAIDNPLGLVFCSIDGGLIHPNNWSKRDFKSALKAAGLPSDVRLYDLRHTIATLALEANMHVKIVRERPGHATTKQTLNTYSHIKAHMQEKVGEQLASLIYGAGGRRQWRGGACKLAHPRVRTQGAHKASERPLAKEYHSLNNPVQDGDR